MGKLFYPLLKLISYNLIILDVKELPDSFYDFFSKKSYSSILLSPDFNSGLLTLDEKLVSNEGFVKQKKATVILNLEKFDSFESYSKTLNKSLLKSIKKANSSLTFFKIDSINDLKKAYSLVKQTNKRNSIRIYNSFSSYKYLFSRSCIDFYAVRDNDKLLSLQGVIKYNRHVNLFSVASSDYAIKNKINANDFLQYKLIETCFFERIKSIDWVGFSGKSTGKEASIDKFKLKWKGDVINYFEYRKANKSLFFSFLRKIFSSNSSNTYDVKSAEPLSLKDEIENSSLPYKEVLLNQFSFLDKNYALSNKFDLDSLNTVLNFAKNNGISNHRIIDFLVSFFNTGDMNLSFSNIKVSDDAISKIQAIIDENIDFIRREGKHSFGKIISICKKSLGRDFDGKKVSEMLTKQLNGLKNEKL
ncbi:hypothetical protein JXA48_04935 [Candidatus Woesearchaeota archaeon]|nr:hypothetical protein [Candidatus Woesearchaeota archaeon]